MAPFLKNILIIDFEATTNDMKISKPIQLGAVLLDKNTLEEKDSFITFIKADYEEIASVVRPMVNITSKDLEGAPTLESVAKTFINKFGFDYFLSSWVLNMDMQFFERMVNSIELDIRKFDYHVVELWSLAYTYLLRKGYSGTVKSQELFTALGVSRNTHDALGDCRMEAEILRKTI